MKKIHPILTVIFIAAAVAVIGYAYVIFGNRYGNKSENIVNDNKGSIIDDFSDYLGGQNDNVADGNLNGNGNINDNDNQNQNQNQNTNANENANSPVRSEMNSKDCDNGCARFKNNPDNYKYCQQTCGDIPVSKRNSADDCASLTGDEKDYCYKDLAVGKKDYALCNQILDAKIKKVCKDRITEDLLN